MQVFNGKVQYAMVSGQDNVPFDIDVTGAITVVSPLDYEVIESYIIAIRAYDLGIIPKELDTFTTVFINVLDSNDNHPVFRKNRYELFTTEEQPSSLVSCNTC